MPWRTLDIMGAREEFVLRSLDNSEIFRDLCQEYGISAKTGYKWQRRFIQEGLGGLKDLSRRPKGHPEELREDVVCEMVRLKQAHLKWGPRKIRELYRRLHGDAPSESSFKRVLDRAGLVTHRKKRRQSPKRPPRMAETAGEPNHIWTVDFKGWWKTAGRQKCEPLTIRDDYSRFLLALRAMDTSRTAAVRREFEKIFEMHGLPRVIRSDNGSPFAASQAPLGLSKLSAWWVALGIDLDRIDPGHPEQNGRHERMHLDIRNELQGFVRGELPEHQRAFDMWRNEFNWERPHEALNMRMPGEVYKNSSRSYDDSLEDIEYPQSYLERKVSPNGIITLYCKKYFLSNSLAGWTVGLKSKDSSSMDIWFDQLRLGTIDMSTEAVIWADQPRLQLNN